MQNLSESEGINLGQKYLRARSALNKSLTTAITKNCIVCVVGEPKEFSWLSATLRIVLGRSTSIVRLENRQGVFRKLIAIKPDLSFVNICTNGGIYSAMAINVLQRARPETRVIAIADILTTGSKIAIAKLGATAILHEDEICTERIAELILKISAADQ
jgi:hypothetical protein